MAHTITERSLPLATGREIHEISLSNGELTIVVHDFGARLHQLFAPDRHGVLENILLSRDDPDSYSHDGGYYGLICGPVAGRIAGARYDEVILEANEGKNTLHSGSHGWERQFWTYKTFQDSSKVGISLSLKDETSGFPGPIETQVTYELAGTTLTVKMTGHAEKDTLFNPAFHPYFNLSADKKTTLDHIIQVSADRLVEADAENIPTGRLLPVHGTAYDLQENVSIRRILQELPQGLDNCLVFSPAKPKTLTLFEPESGRMLTCETERQAVVIYTATHPETASLINNHTPMSANRGVAIEFQELPDAIHHPNFGEIRLKAGQEKTVISTYQFSVMNESKKGA